MQVEKKIIIVDGTITLTAPIKLDGISDKTIIGTAGSGFKNLSKSVDGAGCWYIKGGSDNLIIRNLIFQGPWCLRHRCQY